MPVLDLPFDTWESTADWLLGAPLRVALILLFAILARWAAHRAIRGVVSRAVVRADEAERSSLERVFDSATGVQRERRRQRALTMGSLLRSVATFVIAGVALLTIMAELGMPLAPLLTSAGIGGVAIGFGAQSLVKDFLSGIFMIIEDQYGVGDMVDTGEAVGTVEEVTLRVTRLRDASGVVWFIRNGEIIRIGNKSHGWAVATIDIPVAYDEDPATVLPLLRETVAEVYADPQWSDKLLEEPSVAGVESVSGGTMTLRVFAKCRPGEQWGVPRVIRERAKERFDAEGVRGPRISPFGDAQV
ncbi:mechanosensitive ion channel family protein [Serinicoccus kebangsaanensis]|uniref:mechanosensitive ion channel family protein n=1 Tax=Serinicoccus kebangsaanensis TaxID=2602069 RepID=UPI00124CCD93|nr:mechanosensitive ion channel family protein [Serinicoccus kebangsaanensis]